jgi:hypothetical protein
MSRDADRRRFLETEYQANRSHADHINDHRLYFLKFYATFIVAILSISRYLTTQPTENLDSNSLVIGILATGCIFGLLAVMVMANYWIGRDFMRLKNKVIAEETLKDNLDIERYLNIQKRNLARLPTLRSMFSFVTFMIIIGNQIVLIIFSKYINLSMALLVAVAFVYLFAQLILATFYRWIILGSSTELVRSTVDESI